MSRIYALILALLWLAAAPLAVAARQEFATAPAPSWVNDVEVPAIEDAPSDAQSGVLYLLLDNQTRVTASGVERYSRNVVQVFSATGLDELSQLQFEFDPSYQKLVLHTIRIIRDGRIINALRPNEIRVIQQETELDEQLYNGTLTAIAFLVDLRKGDVLDYSWSVTDDNPAFGNRFADEFGLASSHPARKLRWRLLWPKDRRLSITPRNTTIEPSVGESDGQIEYVWESTGVAAFEYEEESPVWYDPFPVVQVSEFHTWADVVDWAIPLYTFDDPVPTELERQIEAIRQSATTPEAQFLAAVRFVQDDVRYLGIEMGPGSHQPNAPKDVVERRFGDCKDKSVLLVSILRTLGFEAYAALVHSEKGPSLAEQQPSPFAFDHVIVRAVVAGRTIWIDPTTSFERGSLAARQNPPYAMGLVIRVGVADLEPIPPPTFDRPTTTTRYVFVVGEPGSSTDLTVETTYAGPDADAMRYTLADSTPTQITQDSLYYYSEFFPTIASNGAPHIEDDEEANRIVIAETFTISKFWRDGKREIMADTIEGMLGSPRISRRTSPLAIRHPVYVSQSIELRFPEELEIPQSSGSISDEALAYSYKIVSSGNRATLDFTYQTLKDHVDSERVSDHLETILHIRETLSLTLDRDAQKPPLWKAFFSVVVMATLVLLAATALVCWRLLQERS